MCMHAPEVFISNKGSVIFYREGGGLSKFFKFCEFLVIPSTV